LFEKHTRFDDDFRNRKIISLVAFNYISRRVKLYLSKVALFLIAILIATFFNRSIGKNGRFQCGLSRGSFARYDLIAENSRQTCSTGNYDELRRT